MLGSSKHLVKTGSVALWERAYLSALGSRFNTQRQERENKRKKEKRLPRKGKKKK
jgi:hypothetical protein